MRGALYPKGQHPSWCMTGPDCGGDDPNHVGRVSQMYVQSAEARLTIELSRIDDDAATLGTRAGRVQVRLSLSQGAIGGMSAELSVEEVQAAALLLAQYVDYARREDRFACHVSAEQLSADGPL